MNVKTRIYLDNASTTQIDAVVLKKMLPYLGKNFGNPSSLHLEGRLASRALDEAREEVAKAIGSEVDEVIFTSGGTEANNLAIFGLTEIKKVKISPEVAREPWKNILDKGGVKTGVKISDDLGPKKGHIITTCIEHKSILDACKELEKRGFEVTYLSVDSDGLVSLEELESKLRPETILVSVMYANNEIGAIQPIREISQVLKKSEVCRPLFHCDASQAVGALSIEIKELGVDALTVSSSKVYGPKGVGCLYLNNNYQIKPQHIGGGQEWGLRSGTENVAGIVGFGEAMKIANKKQITESARLISLRNYFFDQIRKNIGSVTLNGGLEKRLPNNLNISFKGVEGESLLLLLDKEGIACSTGSACSAKDLSPSYVLLSIGVPLELAHCSLRFSLGRHITKKEVDLTVKALVKCVGKIRGMTTINNLC